MISNDGEEEHASQADDESERVTFGRIIPALGAQAPALGKLLDEADQRRAWAAFHLATSPHGAAALDELIKFANGLAWLARRADVPVPQFGRRILNDIEDGIDGLLQTKEALVLSACRDLMELTVLIRDLRKDDQRLRKWMHSDESTRRQDFGFGHELRMYPEDDAGIPYMGDVNDALLEYTLHSRSLHPAPFTLSEEELSHDRPRELEGQLWVHSFVYEISRHGLSALRQLDLWLAEKHKDIWPTDDELGQPEDFFPVEGGGLDLFEKFHSENSTVDEVALDEAMDMYRPRRKASAD